MPLHAGAQTNNVSMHSGKAMPGEWQDYAWVPYWIAHHYEQEAKAHKVSAVARSRRGFMRQYEEAGTSQEMRKRQVAEYPHQTRGQRRSNFISRHLVQYQKNRTYRGWLALMMWAYRAMPPHEATK